MTIWLLILSTCVCAVALTMTIVNLTLYRREPPLTAHGAPDHPRVSVCIPARNEERNLHACATAILASTHTNLELLVYDDQSSDNTPAILDQLIASDPRVRSIDTSPLPSGWVGKQWACSQLGLAANGEFILFIDADVRLEPSCIAHALRHARALNASLLSTFPRQVTGGAGESLMVPLIHFILLSYLPFARMRSSKDPRASAACGQFILVQRTAYEQAGGHTPIRNSMHDGVKLPRVFRKAGFHTDLYDGTSQVSCRMYEGFAATWRGFAKNAYEGLGSPTLLIFITALHIIGYIVPWVAIFLIIRDSAWMSPLLPLAAAAIFMALVHRLILALRFRQSVYSAVLHPIGILLMAGVQWHSFILSLLGRRAWKGRTLAPPQLTTDTRSPDTAPKHEYS